MSTAIQKYNKKVLDDLEEGDMVEFKRSIYSHWGVYTGDKKVVHVASDGGTQDNIRPKSSLSSCGVTVNKAVVREDDFWSVAGGSIAKKNNQHDDSMQPRPKEQIVEQAQSEIGKIGYNVLTENCEHFATNCRYGEPKSKQVTDYVTYAAVGAAIGAIAGYICSGSDKKK